MPTELRSPMSSRRWRATAAPGSEPRCARSDRSLHAAAIPGWPPCWRVQREPGRQSLMSGAAMVGRQAEAATVAALLEGAALGHGSVLLVTGEAGIGKSRLLQAAVDQARGSGWLVLTGLAVEGG